MSDIAIRAENLSKIYKIGEYQGNHKNLREAIINTLSIPFLQRRRNAQSSTLNPQSDTIWALKDVSFEVKRGEVVGIIGRNGAGKTTLLKVLSRITEPTEGWAEIRGRVGSLLEVGTGFHPELTGRENIFLNGAILGMVKAEINHKFDEIVAFAEIEKFIDTPVKRYSSGMYVRLAFAVAAHLEPEILVVDEVLAVGDVAFQKKCLGKMGDVSKEGRTVLFVSHNMGAVQRLCERAIVLDQGYIVREGPANACVRAYLESNINQGQGLADLSKLVNTKRRGSGLARFHEVELLTEDGVRSAEFRFSQPFRVRLAIASRKDLSNVSIGFSFIAVDGAEIQGTCAHDGNISCNLQRGICVLECHANPMILTPGRYYLRGAIFRQNELYDHIDEMLSFKILEASYDLSATPSNHYVGYVYLPYQWLRVKRDVQ
jgi:lipopolysaccharide transport system ATP-binding protein